MPSDDPPPSSNRREFLTGNALRKQAEVADEILAEAIVEKPSSGDTLRLQTWAMACDFAVILNSDQQDHISAASDALDKVHALEQRMTIYREDSDLSVINRHAFEEAVPIEKGLFNLLQQAKYLSEETDGAFEPTSGPLTALWRACRKEARIPTEQELTDTLLKMGTQFLQFDDASQSARFLRNNLTIDLGGIGKGYALDQIGEQLENNEVSNFLLHGGHSSMLSHGDHNGCGGWPVGIRNPLFPKETWTTLVLRDQALASSGSGVQSFRHDGKKYGHILDPRTGMPSEGMLSVTVLAPTATEADALSTAFFVMGLENARRYCNNRGEIAAVLVPTPQTGRRLTPVFCNIAEGEFFMEDGVDSKA